MRLMLKLLQRMIFALFFTGDHSLSRRPMQRVLLPLQNEGVQVLGRNGHQYARSRFLGNVRSSLPMKCPLLLLR